MADTYGGTGITAEEKEKGFKEEGQRQLKGALSTGAQWAAIGAAGGPLAALAAGGAGMLVGAITSSGQDPGHFAKIQAEKKAARVAEDAARVAHTQAATKSKSAKMASVLPPASPAGSDIGVLAQSMPLTPGMSAPMDPFRTSVRTKFGWS